MVDGDGGVGADMLGRSRATVVAVAAASASAVRGTGDGLLDED